MNKICEKILNELEQCGKIKISNFKFPDKQELKLKLKDMLEEEVDEKYYLSSTAIQGRLNTNYQKYKLEENVINDKDVHPTILARYDGAPTLYIKNATKQGYLEAYEGDSVNLTYPNSETRRGRVGDQVAQTLQASDTMGVVVNDTKNLKEQLCDYLIESNKVKENDVIRHSYSTSRMNNFYTQNSENNNTAPTLDTRCDCLGVVVNDNSVYGDKEKQLFTEDGNIKRYINSNIVDEFKEGQMATTSFPNGYGHGPRTHDESICLNCIDKPSVKQNLRIRKLTPKEYWRLMGFSDEAFDKASKVNSNAQLYKQAGNSIVVNVLYEIFKNLF